MAPVAQQEADFLRIPQIPLSLEDRTALRAMFESQAFKRAWHNAKLCEPNEFPPGDLSGPAGEKIAINRLHQKQGWKLFEVALMAQANDPKPAVKRAEENYPDSGMEIVDPNKLPKSPGPAPLPLHPKPAKS